MFKTIADVRRRAREAGCHFFDRDTMRFLASRVRSKLYAGRYFITSEGASFTVREAEDCGADGLIVRIPATQVFQQHLRIEYARKACRELAREVRE